MSDPLKTQVQEAMKAAMRAKDKERLSTIRLMLAEIKRIEVDERTEVDDARALSIFDKMLKQRRDSITQYEAAGRDELAAKEHDEIRVIQEFMPKPLSEEEIQAFISSAVEASGASSVRDMGKVMALVKPKVQGRVDMGKVSAQIKHVLGELEQSS